MDVPPVAEVETTKNRSSHDCSWHSKRSCYRRSDHNSSTYEDAPPNPLEARELGALLGVIWRKLLSRAPKDVHGAEMVFRVLASAQPAKLVPAVSVYRRKAFGNDSISVCNIFLHASHVVAA